MKKESQNELKNQNKTKDDFGSDSNNIHHQLFST